MIPKIIHYCWFGRGPLPEDAQKCIASWKKYLPDYEIKEWNEDNFDINSLSYTREAYDAKKYAFVSDYVRFWVLYKYGGVYFDTDVEVIAPMDDIIGEGTYMGKEIDGIGKQKQAINPGLGFAAEPGMELFRKFLDEYAEMHFILPDGSYNPYSMIRIITNMLEEEGLRPGTEIQRVAGVNIYPSEYFNPWDDTLGILRKTKNTRTVHWYSKSWMKQDALWVVWVKRILRRLFGKSIGEKIKKIY